MSSTGYWPSELSDPHMRIGERRNKRALQIDQHPNRNTHPEFDRRQAFVLWISSGYVKRAVSWVICISQDCFGQKTAILCANSPANSTSDRTACRHMIPKFQREPTCVVHRSRDRSLGKKKSGQLVVDNV